MGGEESWEGAPWRVIIIVIVNIVNIKDIISINIINIVFFVFAFVFVFVFFFCLLLVIEALMPAAQEGERERWVKMEDCVGRGRRGVAAVLTVRLR